MPHQLRLNFGTQDCLGWRGLSGSRASSISGYTSAGGMKPAAVVTRLAVVVFAASAAATDPGTPVEGMSLLRQDDRIIGRTASGPAATTLVANPFPAITPLAATLTAAAAAATTTIAPIADTAHGAAPLPPLLISCTPTRPQSSPTRVQPNPLGLPHSSRCLSPQTVLYPSRQSAHPPVSFLP